MGGAGGANADLRPAEGLLDVIVGSHLPTKRNQEQGMRGNKKSRASWAAMIETELVRMLTFSPSRMLDSSLFALNIIMGRLSG